MIATREIHFNDARFADRRGITLDEARLQHVNAFLVQYGLPTVSGWLQGIVPAHISHGRWLALCPGDFCKGAEYVDPAWPYMVCCSCGAGPFWVEFVDEETRSEIEALLNRRPHAGAMNWYPLESLERLQLENAIMLDGLIDELLRGIAIGGTK